MKREMKFTIVTAVIGFAVLLALAWYAVSYLLDLIQSAIQR